MKPIHESQSVVAADVLIGGIGRVCGQRGEAANIEGASGAPRLGTAAATTEGPC